MRSLLFGIVSLGALTQEAASQRASDSQAGLVAAIQTLRVGTTVRIAEHGKRADWTILRLAGDSINLRSTAGERRLALSEVDTLWARQSASGRGGVIGAIVGGVGLAALTVGLVNGICTAPGGCRNEYPRAIIAGLAVGGLGGAFLGLGLGSFQQRWRRIYP